MQSLLILYFGIISLYLVECGDDITYLYEHCGRTVPVASYIRLQAFKGSQPLPDKKCVVYLSATSGNSARIHARFLSIDMAPQCGRTYIKLYEGTGNTSLTPPEGLCGDFLYKTYSYTTVNESIMTFAFSPDIFPKQGSFDAIITTFQEMEGDEKCLNNWWKCGNGRCVDPSTKCNSFDNCGDNSDETYENCTATMYLYEYCGLEINVDDSAVLKLKRNDGYLIPERMCDNIIVAHGKFPDLGEVVNVYAHIRSVSLSQPDQDGECSSARIDIYSGLRDKRNLTGSKGLCGNSLEIADYSTTADNFMPIEFKTDAIIQQGNFEIILTSFHTGHCLSGEFRCDNGWCVDSTVKCDGYQNCGDKSDESDQLCKKQTKDGGYSKLTIILIILASVLGFCLFISCPLNVAMYVRYKRYKKKGKEEKKNGKDDENTDEKRYLLESSQGTINRASSINGAIKINGVSRNKRVSTDSDVSRSSDDYDQSPSSVSNAQASVANEN